MSFSKKTIVGVLMVAGFLVASIFLLARLEVTTTYFDSYQDVTTNPGILEAGWLPSWLPKSAYNIKESHDIDTNESWLSFGFSGLDVFYTSFCTPTTKEEVILSSGGSTKRFPRFVSDIKKQLESDQILDFYVCKDSATRYLAIDTKANIAYMYGTISKTIE